jgi:hypothetical protein
MPSPPLAPDFDQDAYLALGDLGPRFGRVWRETDEEKTDLATLLTDLMPGQYANPARIVSFNAVEGWSRDVTDDVANELRHRYADRCEVSTSLEDSLVATAPMRRFNLRCFDPPPKDHSRRDAIQGRPAHAGLLR